MNACGFLSGAKSNFEYRECAVLVANMNLRKFCKLG